MRFPFRFVAKGSWFQEQLLGGVIQSTMGAFGGLFRGATKGFSKEGFGKWWEALTGAVKAGVKRGSVTETTSAVIGGVTGGVTQTVGAAAHHTVKAAAQPIHQTTSKVLETGLDAVLNQNNLQEIAEYVGAGVEGAARVVKGIYESSPVQVKQFLGRAKKGSRVYKAPNRHMRERMQQYAEHTRGIQKEVGSFAGHTKLKSRMVDSGITQFSMKNWVAQAVFPAAFVGYGAYGAMRGEVRSTTGYIAADQMSNTLYDVGTPGMAQRPVGTKLDTLNATGDLVFALHNLRQQRQV